MLLAVNPNNRLKTPLAAIEPPVWLSLLVSHYIEDGKDVNVLDAEALDLSVQETANTILASGATEVILVVMGNNPSVSSTPKMVVTCELLTLLKGEIDISLTGLHPMAVGGESVLYWRPTKCLPIHWELLPMHLYRAHNWHCLDGSSRTPYASTFTSLGCPYNCYYCNIHTLYQSRTMLYRSIPGFLQEIEELVSRYKIRNIKIWDELFTLKEDRVLSICTGLKAYNLNIWAYARLDTITARMLEAMKVSGINWLAYGFESIADRKFISRTEDVIKRPKDAGINIIANFMFGIPGSTATDDKKSLEFAMAHLFEFVNFYDAKPYPGSQWYQDTNPQWSYERFNQYGSKSSFRENAFVTYFTNPDYLNMIRAKFGEQAVGQINDMLIRRI